MQFYSKQRSSPKLSHACCSGVCAPLCEGASCARATTGWVAAAAGSSTQMQAGGRQTGKMEMSVIKDMVIGKLAPLVSTSRLSYCSILNLMNRVEGQFTSEHVTRNSFHQFQYEKTDLAKYHKLGLDISELEKKIMSGMIRPEGALLYLVPGSKSH
ncbi:hypothetical protein SETIT_2G357400v2 [Setaria italica]|uniref:Uncharacterized protein n=1 Tax=Setaria italica TaxID=4555 RepID=A0A368Q7B1_SETIT|nr:hypothetical protein SETIT_2G357400v2 [Setaria italica]